MSLQGFVIVNLVHVFGSRHNDFCVWQTQSCEGIVYRVNKAYIYMPFSRSLIFIITAKGFWKDLANRSQKIEHYVCSITVSSDFQTPGSGLKKEREAEFLNQLQGVWKSWRMKYPFECLI